MKYCFWHYTLAVGQMIIIYKNLVWFLANFFSLPVIATTLFSPWKRMGESYGRGVDIELNAASFIVNTMMRVTGFLFRVVIGLIGLLAVVAFSILYLLLFVAWLLWPLFIIFLAAFGLYLIFK